MSGKDTNSAVGNIVGAVGILVALLTLIFGDNLFEQVTGRQFSLTGADPTAQVEPTPATTDNGGGTVDTTCASALPTRLRIGGAGRVTADNNSLAVWILAEAQSGSEKVSKMEPGDGFIVIAGPICDAENQWWYWKVRSLTTTHEGWSAEGDPVAGYFLEPD